MPIKITNCDSGDEIAWLCNDDWELPTQLTALEAWLVEYEVSDPPVEAVADIGYSVRPDAFGGGAVLSCESMRRFSNAQIEIHFSEYPTGDDPDEETNDTNKSQHPTA